MPTPGEILQAVISIVILGLLVYFMKKWIEGIETRMKQALVDAGLAMQNSLDNVIKSVDGLKAEISTLFQRSETDRLARSQCQLEASKTYATIKSVKDIEKRVLDLERAD